MIHWVKGYSHVIFIMELTLLWKRKFLADSKSRDATISVPSYYLFYSRIVLVIVLVLVLVLALKYF